MARLDGKVALITGGASGMGMVASELFASEGAKVVLTDVTDNAGEQVAEKIRADGGEATYVHADVSSEVEAKAMVDAAVGSYGALSILYNNAGVMLADDGSVDSTDESIWDTTLAINVKGVAHGCKYGIPATNPFVGKPGDIGEIYAYGMRDPHRFSWDTGGQHRLFLGHMDPREPIKVDHGDRLFHLREHVTHLDGNARLARAEGTGDESDGRAEHFKNDEARMTNDKLMTKPE